MNMRHTAAALAIDAYTALAQHNGRLAEGLAADIAAGATLDDVRVFVDVTPILSRDEASLLLRAAAHLIALRDQPEAIP